MNSALAPLLLRRSTPSRLLTEPAPSQAQLTELIEAAARVPDHGRLQPWRLIEVSGESRATLGRALVDMRRARGDELDEAAIEKDLHRFDRAPLVLIVVARLTPGHKIPEQEQWLSAGALAQNLLLGADCLGFGAQWLTGWPAYDREAARLFGLSENEKVVAFIYLGTRPAERPADRERPTADQLLSRWTPP